MSKLICIAKTMRILCYLLFPFWLSAQDHLTEEKTSQAMIHYQDKEYAQAAKLYEEILEKDYKNSYLLTQCGLSYYHQQKFQEAKEKFRLATLYGNVDDRETMALYHSNLSAAYSNLDDDEPAFEHAVKAYYLDKERLWNAASMAQNLGRYDDCLKLMNEAEEGTLHNAYRTLYGRSYYRKEEFRKAIQQYKTFFDHYDPNDDTVPLVIRDDRNFYLYSCLHVLAKSDDEQEVNEIIDQVIQVQKAHPMVMYRQDMLAFFTIPKNICKTYGLDVEMSKRLFYAWVNDPNKYDELLFSFYALNAYHDTYQLTAKYLQDDVGELEREFHEIHFLSALHLYLQDRKKQQTSANDERLEELLFLFDDFFEADRIYSDEQFMVIPRIENLLMGLLAAFRSNYAKGEEQERIAPVLIKFLERLPNESIRSKIKDDLGYN